MAQNFSPGDFSAAKFEDVCQKADEFWSNSNQKRHQTKPLTIFNCLFENQQIQLNEQSRMALSDKKYCVTYSIAWLCACNEPVLTCDEAMNEGPNKVDFCSPTGKQLSADKSFITTNCMGFATSREIYASECKDKFTYEEKFMTAWNQMKWELDEFHERNAIAWVLSCAAEIPDEWTTNGEMPGNKSTEGDSWIVTRQMQNAEFLLCLFQEFTQCRPVDPILLSGRMYQKELGLVGMGSEGCCNYDKLLENTGFNDWCFNTTDFDELAGSRTLLAVDRAQLAFIDAWEFDSSIPVEVPSKEGRKVAFHTMSDRLRLNAGGLQPKRYDVTITQKCVGNSMADWCEVLVMRTCGGYAKNPEGCDPCGPVYQVSEQCLTCEEDK